MRKDERGELLYEEESGGGGRFNDTWCTTRVPVERLDGKASVVGKVWHM